MKKKTNYIHITISNFKYKDHEEEEEQNHAETIYNSSNGSIDKQQADSNSISFDSDAMRWYVILGSSSAGHRCCLESLMLSQCSHHKIRTVNQCMAVPQRHTDRGGNHSQK